MMTVRVASEHRIEGCHPGVETGVELTPEGVIGSEGRVGDIREDRSTGPAREQRIRRPLDDPPPGGGPSPAHLPDADALDSPRLGSGADDVVADGRADERRFVVCGDRRDEEFGDRDLAQTLDQPLQFATERCAVEREAPQVASPFVSRSPRHLLRAKFR